VTHQHLLRAMDALMDHAERVEAELAKQIRPLVDRDLSIIFYDLTTVRIHGEGHVEDDIRAFGMNKERGGIARQFVLGVVQTAEGLPLMHTVHRECPELCVSGPGHAVSDTQASKRSPNIMAN
jgi:hypothetical protein